jgi:hypothetical protein
MERAIAGSRSGGAGRRLALDPDAEPLEPEPGVAGSVLPYRPIP